MIFLLIAAANDISRRADYVAELDRGPYVPDPIRTSVILNAYNVYSFAHSDDVRHTLIASVALEFLNKRHVRHYILPVRKIISIAFVFPERAIALQLYAISATIFKINRVTLVATWEIGITHQTNYD